MGRVLIFCGYVYVCVCLNSCTGERIIALTGQNAFVISYDIGRQKKWPIFLSTMSMSE